VTSDNKMDDAFTLHEKNGLMHAFRSSRKGLNYLDITHNVGIVLIHTVEKNN
jgi:hypothetical protein